LKSSAQQDAKHKASADANMLETYAMVSTHRFLDPQIMEKAVFNFLVGRYSIIFFLKLSVPLK
jgi:hypothetical protein